MMNEYMTRFSEELSKATEELIREHNIACEELTKEQLASAFKQAVVCGDFVRMVQSGSRAQAVVYMPFAREQELLNEIEELKEKLKDAQYRGPYS